MLEGLEDLLPLTKVLEEERESAGDEWRIVVHDQVEEHAQERPTACEGRRGGSRGVLYSSQIIRLISLRIFI